MVKVTKDGKAVDPEELTVMDAVRLFTRGVTFDDGKLAYKGHIQPIVLMGNDGTFKSMDVPYPITLFPFQVQADAFVCPANTYWKLLGVEFISDATVVNRFPFVIMTDGVNLVPVTGRIAAVAASQQMPLSVQGDIVVPPLWELQLNYHDGAFDAGDTWSIGVEVIPG